MNYFIKKDSDYSVLSLELIKNSHTDYDKFFKDIQNATVTFSMVEADTGLIKISKNKAEVCIDKKTNDCTLTYEFGPRDVNKPGSYIANFNINFNNKEKLIVPIREDLKIFVTN